MSDLSPTPIPDAVADLKASQWPPHVKDALCAEADAKRHIGVLRPLASAEDAQDRQELLGRLHAARKVLAARPQRHGGAA